MKDFKETVSLATPDAWASKIMCVGSEYGKVVYDKVPITSLNPLFYSHEKLFSGKTVIGLLKAAYYDGYTDREQEIRKGAKMNTELPMAQGPVERPVRPLVERLRDTPNWMRESYGSWKDCVLKYDRAPFEAADEIERIQSHLLAVLEIARTWQPTAAALLEAAEKAKFEFEEIAEWVRLEKAPLRRQEVESINTRIEELRAAIEAYKKGMV